MPSANCQVLLYNPAASHCPPPTVNLQIQLAGLILLFLGCAEAITTLPPEPAPAHHWPLWLRILAVIAVLLFVRLVGGSMRGGAGGRGPGPTNPE